MKLIIGLGNPGIKYERSRHNIGFMVLDRLLSDLEPLKRTYWDEEKKMKSLVKRVKVNGEEVLLAKPTTFMNNSGWAVKMIADYYHIDCANIYVVQDDIDLPFGLLRIRFGGAAGGHKGVESIITHLGTDKFLRIRLGIGKPRRIQNSKFRIQNLSSIEDYVLAKFGRGEAGKVRTMTHQATRAIQLILEHGIEKYMSKYNQK